MNPRVLALRAPLIAVYALILVTLATRSSLTKMLPFPLTAFVFIVAWLLVCLALMPALFAANSPLPPLLFALVPAVAVACYEESHLDWLRVLKDYGVVDAGSPSPMRLALAAAAILMAWGIHALDLAARLRWRALERGVDAEQAAGGARASLARSALAAGFALAGALGLLVVALAGTRLPIAGERLAIIVPLAATLLIAGAGVALTLRAKGEPSSSEE